VKVELARHYSNKDVNALDANTRHIIYIPVAGGRALDIKAIVQR
jgi:hypothetical protein